MPLAAERGASTGDSGRAPGNGNLQLLRSSHIFASAVREVLELKLVREASPVPLTLSQFHLLKLMHLNGRHQVGQVADFLGVSSPAATKNIDKLEAHGLVVRAPSKGDRRATLLSVSPKGRRLVRRYEALKAQRLAPVLAKFQPRELEQLTDLLERFSLSLLEKELAGEGDGVCLRCDAYVQAGCSVGRLRGGCPYQTARRARAARARPDANGASARADSSGLSAPQGG
jgi:DNA-binding MarR family transcriptional regulator